ncbi:MAG TPA: cation-transporting P-type ATPase, partial [Kofleriaceae bacterium]|nr:cation-transporting P-type ATPase [Kofleriaceae bacterium]
MLLAAPPPEPAAAPRWHALAADEVVRLLGADRGGLTRAEAAARLARFGPNAPAEARRRSAVGRLGA